MILVHSKAPTAAEVLEFMRQWDRPTPIVVVPTLYPSVRFEELEGAGIKLVIFANQVLRGAMKGMQEVLTTLARTKHLEAVTSQIVTLEEVYAHVGVSELKAYEAEFLPTGADRVRAVIIAAGFDKGLLPLTEDRPKCLLDIKGRTILERQLETLRACGIHDVVVVRGYKKDRVTLPAIRCYDNDRYEETGEIYSLFVAEPEIRGRVLFLYSDILFDQAVLEKLLRSPEDISIVVDRAWIDQRDRLLPLAKPMDLVITDNSPRSSHRFLPSEDNDRLLRVGQRLPPDQATGEFIGMALFSERGAELLRDVYQRAREGDRGRRFHESDSLERAAFTDMLQEFVERGQPVACVNIYKGWLEIDTFEDYQRAWGEIRK
jgi:phosphoenolpyruvate phosphomutase